jgi:hypothetical protein
VILSPPTPPKVWISARTLCGLFFVPVIRAGPEVLDNYDYLLSFLLLFILFLGCFSLAL